MTSAVPGQGDGRYAVPLQDPGDEHVVLTDYERRQLELIEQGLVQEDSASATGPWKRHAYWITVMIFGGWVTVMGMVIGAAVLVLLGSATAAAAFALHRRIHRHSASDG